MSESSYPDALLEEPGILGPVSFDSMCMANRTLASKITNYNITIPIPSTFTLALDRPPDRLSCSSYVITPPPLATSYSACPENDGNELKSHIVIVKALAFRTA